MILAIVIFVFIVSGFFAIVCQGTENPAESWVLTTIFVLSGTFLLYWLDFGIWSLPIVSGYFLMGYLAVLSEIKSKYLDADKKYAHYKSYEITTWKRRFSAESFDYDMHVKYQHHVYNDYYSKIKINPATFIAWFVMLPIFVFDIVYTTFKNYNLMKNKGLKRINEL